MNPRLTRRDMLRAGGAGIAGAALSASVRRSALASHCPTDEEVTLTWWDYFSEGANAEAMAAQLQRYMDAHPNVTIERTAIPFADLKQKLLQGAVAGQLPDIAVIDNPDHQAFAALGILEDLTDRIEEWGQGDAFFEGPWQSTMYEGKNYGIPDNSNTLVLWYNTALTEAAGVDPPETWEDLRAAAEALTEGDRYGLAVSGAKAEGATFQWLPFLWQTGEDIPTLDSEGGREALQLWVDLVNAGFMSRGILGWTQQDVLTQFQNEKAAMMINGPWQVPVLKEESPDLEWEITTLPKQEQAASILGGENTAIIKGSKNIDAAWCLLTWRQEPENLKQYLIDAGKLPSREDLAEDPHWAEDPVLKVFVDQLKVAKPRAYGPSYPEISSAIQDAIQGAVSGQSDVAAALAKAQAAINPLLPEGQRAETD